MINEFEGPMDLLLHLIKKDNIDIIDISIDEITKQYLEYIEAMENLNLDIASEYLIMASELLEIKSSKLLPKQENSEDEEEDLEQTFINRLIEYQQYKEVTGQFKELEESRKDIYTKIPDSLSEYKEDGTPYLGNITLDDLVLAFNKFLTRKEMEKPLNTKVATKEYSISQRSNEIRKVLLSKKKIIFSQLFDNYSKDYLVITFLSILSMAKKQEIEIKQDDNFEEIYLSLKEENNE